MHDNEQPAETDDEIWREAAERFETASSAESDNRSRGVIAKKFRWGDQWPADIANSRRTEDRPTLTINHTDVQCQRQENVLRQQRPRIKVHPMGDGASVQTAKLIQGMIRHIENRSFSSIAYDAAAKSIIDVGWGYFRIRADFISERSFDQELLIDPIANCFRVYMDPCALSPVGADQGYCFISDEMKRAEYNRRYPKADQTEFSYLSGVGDDKLMFSWSNKATIRLAEYYRVHEIPEKLIMMNDGRAIYASELPALKLQRAMDYQPAVNALTGKPIERQSCRRVVQWFKLNGTTIVDRKTIPGRYIPVIRMIGNVEEIEGQLLRKGMVQNLMDPARMYNYWRTQQTERYALAPKAPWVAAAGQIDNHPEWHDANRKSYSVLTYDPITVSTAQGDVMVPPPQRQPPAPVEDGMVQASAGAEHDLMAVAGMPQENPEIKARIIGGNKYLQRRQGMQDLTHFQYYDNQTLSIAWAGVLLLEQIPFYYDTQRVQQIIGDDEQPKMVEINVRSVEKGLEKIKNDVTRGIYSVFMDTGPDYATARQEGQENMIETLGTPLGQLVVETGADVVLRNMDWHGAEELADRVAIKIPAAMEKIVADMPDEAKNIISTLSQQLEQAQQTIQQQTLEIKYKGSIEELKIQGQLEKTDRDNETKLRQEAMRGSTSRDVAEIHGATQLLNTQTESAAEERAADRLIEAGTKDRNANGAS